MPSSSYDLRALTAAESGRGRAAAYLLRLIEPYCSGSRSDVSTNED